MAHIFKVLSEVTNKVLSQVTSGLGGQMWCKKYQEDTQVEKRTFLSAEKYAFVDTWSYFVVHATSKPVHALAPTFWL